MTQELHNPHPVSCVCIHLEAQCADDCKESERTDSSRSCAISLSLSLSVALGAPERGRKMYTRSPCRDAGVQLGGRKAR